MKEKQAAIEIEDELRILAFGLHVVSLPFEIRGRTGKEKAESGRV